MKNLKYRLKKVEQKVNSNEIEQITITLGDETCIFKNTDDLRRLWVEAVIESDEDKKGN